MFVLDSEFVYRDSHGGITLYNADNLTTKVLMTNSTFVSTKTLIIKKSLKGELRDWIYKYFNF